MISRMLVVGHFTNDDKHLPLFNHSDLVCCKLLMNIWISIVQMFLIELYRVSMESGVMISWFSIVPNPFASGCVSSSKQNPKIAAG